VIDGTFDLGLTRSRSRGSSNDFSNSHPVGIRHWLGQ
jgi:hypothetical protein